MSTTLPVSCYIQQPSYISPFQQRQHDNTTTTATTATDSSRRSAWFICPMGIHDESSQICLAGENGWINFNQLIRKKTFHYFFNFKLQYWRNKESVISINFLCCLFLMEHKHTHTHIRTHTHTHTHTHLHTYAHTYTHTHTTPPTHVHTTYTTNTLRSNFQFLCHESNFANFIRFFYNLTTYW